MPSLSEQVMEAFRQRLLARDAETMREMARRWLEVENAIAARIQLLADQVAQMRANGETVSAAKIYRLENYRRLLSQAKAEVSRYNVWAAQEITRMQKELSALGMEQAAASIRAAYLDAGQIGGYFDLLPIEAIEAMIGRAGDGTPLYKLLMQDYAESIMELTQILINSTAQGINPRETAKLMAEAMGGNLDRALTIARTEQLRVYRDASRQQMQSSGVVDGYIRRCALSDRTCMACLALDGTEYATDELMEVHPNDRCFMQPKIKGLDPVGAQSGAEWFAKQSEETQREMMSDTKYDAWKAGEFDFHQLAHTYEDPTWGPSVKVASLGELAGVP